MEEGVQKLQELQEFSRRKPGKQKMRR